MIIFSQRDKKINLLARIINYNNKKFDEDFYNIIIKYNLIIIKFWLSSNFKGNASYGSVEIHNEILDFKSFYNFKLRFFKLKYFN